MKLDTNRFDSWADWVDEGARMDDDELGKRLRLVKAWTREFLTKLPKKAFRSGYADHATISNKGAKS